jgi:hypothetical protein
MKFKNRTQAKKVTGISSLGGINTSAKLSHNEEIGVYTYVLYLAPGKNSGYEVCPNATKACRGACLYASGRVKVEEYSGKNTIKKCRINRTKLFFEHQQFFMDWLIAEIKAAQAKAERDNMVFSVRLNGTSDIRWEDIPVTSNTNIFDYFSKVQFYDYTKAPDRYYSASVHDNYHLTFSYTGEGENRLQAMRILLDRGNVAIVFDTKKGKPLPETFLGCEVIDGDITDYRPADPKGVVVGLRFKELASKKANELAKQSPFVVNV